MCEFKVGDLVAHKTSGNKYVVKRVSARSVWFDGYNDNYIPAMFQLVERKQEKPAPYIFKVGDKGKCRDGTPYEVVAIDIKGLKKGRTIAAVREGYMYGFCPDGTEGGGSRSWDLMPPTKTVWRVELTGVKDPKTSGLLDMTSTRYYDTEENARKGIARGVRAYITVKGPFPEEREA